MKLSVIGIILSIFGGACAQLFMKAGMIELSGISMKLYPGLLMDSPSLFLPIATGIFLYLCSVVTWMIALRHFELNAIYPLLALGYVVVYVAAAYWPGIEEAFSIQKTAGIVLIVAGVAFASHNSRTNNP